MREERSAATLLEDTCSLERDGKTLPYARARARRSRIDGKMDFRGRNRRSRHGANMAEEGERIEGEEKKKRNGVGRIWRGRFELSDRWIDK